jgi:Fur family transcriptional regulator, ferric uptake regulator
MSPDKHDLYLTLRNKGFRLTPQRERIIDTFFDLPPGDHLGAEELYQLFTDDPYADVSLATAYRTLKLLAHVGVLREVDIDERKQYELIRAEESPHHHLVCRTCGATEEFESEHLHDHFRAIATNLGFDLTEAALTLSATCLPTYPTCPLRSGPKSSQP